MFENFFKKRKAVKRKEEVLRVLLYVGIFIIVIVVGNFVISYLFACRGEITSQPTICQKIKFLFDTISFIFFLSLLIKK